MPKVTSESTFGIFKKSKFQLHRGREILGFGSSLPHHGVHVRAPTPARISPSPPSTPHAPGPHFNAARRRLGPRAGCGIQVGALPGPSWEGSGVVMRGAAPVTCHGPSFPFPLSTPFRLVLRGQGAENFETQNPISKPQAVYAAAKCVALAFWWVQAVGFPSEKSDSAPPALTI